MTEIRRYHRHADGAVHLEEDAESLTICQRSHMPVVVLDPADLPHGYGNPAALRAWANSALADQWHRDFLRALAQQIEQQTSPPVAEPVVGGWVVDANGDTWVRWTSGAGKTWLKQGATPSPSAWPFTRFEDIPQPLTVLRPEAGA